MRILVVVTLALATLLLSGCMGNAVTVAGQGVSSGTQSKSLDCGATGTVSSGNQGTGKMTVKVTDGGGATIFSSGDFGAGQSGQAEQLSGEPGTWTLKVSTGFGYAGQWAVTLTC